MEWRMEPADQAKHTATSGRVLILILTFNGSRYVGDCLGSLRQITYPEDGFEILVVDNGSTDDTVALIRDQERSIKVIENRRNLGFAAGNNVGLRYAIQQGFEFVYLLNQDTAVEPNFLSEAIGVIRADPKVASVQSKLLLYHDRARINTIGNELHYLGFGYAGGCQTPDRDLAVREITTASGCSMLIRVSAIQDVGLLNEEFFLYCEDQDLGWRFRLGGYKSLLAPKSVVYHKYLSFRTFLRAKSSGNQRSGQARLLT
jgi:hypothetical protein